MQVTAHIETEFRIRWKNAAGYTVKPITVWSRLGKNNRWEHNHIEDGHAAGNEPTPFNDIQRGHWKGAIWKKELAYLDGSKVVRIGEKN